MSRNAVFGIRPEALPAWVSLGLALDDMADQGQTPICRQRPHQWTEDAPEHARKDAAEACNFCPARNACGAFADANHERSGVWGGADYTPLTKKRKAAA